MSGELLIRLAGWLGAGCVIGVCAGLVVRSLSVKAGLIGGLLAGVLAAAGFMLTVAKFGEVPGHLAATSLVVMATSLMIARARARELIMDDDLLADFGDGDALGARVRSVEAKSGTKPTPPAPQTDLDVDVDIEPEPPDNAAAPEPQTKAEADPVEEKAEDPPVKAEAPKATPMSRPGGLSTDPPTPDATKAAPKAKPKAEAPKATPMSRPGGLSADPPTPDATKSIPKARPKAKAKAKKAKAKAKAKPAAKPVGKKPQGSGKPSWMQ